MIRSFWKTIRPRLPGHAGDLLMGAGAFLIALSSVMAVGVANSARRDAEERADASDDRVAELEEAVGDSAEISACRAKLATDVTVAQTRYTFAQGDLAGALGEIIDALATARDPMPAVARHEEALAKLPAARHALDLAVTTRDAFESAPNVDCLVDPADVQVTVPTTVEPAPPETTTTLAATHRRSATRRPGVLGSSTSTTTTRTTTTTTTRPRPTSTTRPSLCSILSIPDIPSVPREVTCII